LGNINRYLLKVSISLIMAALITGMAGCDGDDYSQNLEIWDWYDLDAVRYNPAGNYTLMNDLDSTTAGYEELASPTANGGKGWQPIGIFIPQCPYEGLTGTFDGQGYEIRDLFINCPDDNSVGLFKFVDKGGCIQDIGVVNATVVGWSFVGSLAGVNHGTISNCYATGSVSGGDQCVGGLVGMNEETVNNSYSAGSVTGDICVGGLVGLHDNGTLSDSYSKCSVTGESGIGGLVGFISYGSMSNSYSTGSVTGEGAVGGLVGANDQGTVSNSYYSYDEFLINGVNVITGGALFDEDFGQWLANDKFLDVNGRLPQEDGYYIVNNVSDFKQLLAFGQNGTLKFRLTSDLDLGDEANFYIPYLAGELDGNGHRISNLSFNFDFISPVGLFGYLAPGGKVTQAGVENVNITAGSCVGGLVGQNRGTVSKSYSTGSVTGHNYVGGLVGYKYEGIVDNSCSTCSVIGERTVGGLVGDNYEGTVNNSYSTGSVTGDNNVGGLVGWNAGTVSDSFWDTQTSGQATSDGGTGMNTTEMKGITTFSLAGWNITAVGGPGERNPAYIWNIVHNETYPFLSWEP
jgi:hypothetical protein